MEKKSYTIIGNWKMYFTFKQTLTWLKNHKENLTALLNNSKNQLILCPSFESLSEAHTKLSDTTIYLGAQECSDHKQGAFTGQVSAQSLAEAGCQYCIIGHSERRFFQFETDEMITKKCALLLENNITPIICVGESEQQHKEGTAQAVIQKQLALIAELITTLKTTKQVFIAYEPIWAIGTGNIPEHGYLQEIFSSLYHFTKSWPNNTSLKLLYGGSVNAKNIQTFTTIEHLEGFLIGGASTDFQELKKIIELV